ncbi:MAG: acyl-[acyl-carrier-protein] thioesterase [Chloroflexota bacterium]
MDIARTHEQSYRVRFDEADARGYLRPSGLLRYAQDLAWQHSDAAGFDRGWYEERGVSWLVRMVSLGVIKPVAYGDRLIATTRVIGWRRVWARRRTSFELADGTSVAEADTDWVLLTREGRPTRIPDEIARYFAPGGSFRPDRIELPETPIDAISTETAVRPAMVDPLGHLNNAAYLDLVDEAVAPLADEAPARSGYRVEYLRPALPGAVLHVAAWRADDQRFACRMTDAAGSEVCRALVS